MSTEPLGSRLLAAPESRAAGRRSAMRTYARRALAPWSPIIVNYRAPFEPRPDGTFKRGSGGVVQALLSLAGAMRADWVACARTDAERRMVAGDGAQSVSLDGEVVKLHYALPDPEEFRQHYAIIANPVLWFVHHFLWDLAREPVIDETIHRAWDQGYVALNRRMADEVVRAANAGGGQPLVMTHDYQLYLTPRFVREQLPNATLQHFVHVPWPGSAYWSVLPARMRDGIVDGLLANDIVGFQSGRDVRNFLLTCEERLDAMVDHREEVVVRDGHVTWVRRYPISVDVNSLERRAAGAAVTRELSRMQPRTEKLIIRVDRTDPSKNILRGFIAYERLLEAHRDLRGRVQFHAFLQPSRQDVPAYREYLQEIRRAVARVNMLYGNPDWQPIRFELGESTRHALACYLDFDVLLVNPIYDGMNLVAKEGALLNRRDGVLVLSENAGAHDELGRHALSVNPFDVGETAAAMHRALTMPAAERHSLASGAREAVRLNDIDRWISRQVQDLRDLVGVPSLRAG
jgi:trehalose 6-phosphate synthase